MKKYKPNAWNFPNIDESLISKDKSYQLVYGALCEIAMASPLSGTCYLIHSKSKKSFMVSDFAGGPAISDQLKNRFAFPIWISNYAQQIRVVDLDKNQIITYQKEFRVLELTSFEGDLLNGIDSPLIDTEELYFDLRLEKTETVASFSLQSFTETYI